jgi:hypothetical protein
MKQLVEYEWKPLFCDKCQKLGHICNKDPPKPVQKQWKPKPAAVQASPSTQPIAQKTNDAADTWTTVHTNGKAKGKNVKEVSSATDVTCSNGFEPLGSLNGTLVIHDTGQ